MRSPREQLEDFVAVTKDELRDLQAERERTVRALEVRESYVKGRLSAYESSLRLLGDA